jgi:hypothetical protein
VFDPEVSSQGKGERQDGQEKRVRLGRENKAGIGIRTEMNETEGSNYSHDIIKYTIKICPPSALTVVSDPLLK